MKPAERLAQCRQEALRPDPRLSPDSWAETHRVLSTAESPIPGQWRTDRSPHLREPMERLALHDPTPRVVMMFTVQSGKSECGLNWMGYIVDCIPCPILLVRPTWDDCEKFSKQRLAHLFDCPRLRDKVSEHKSRDSSNTITVKTFAGGILLMVGSNSPVGVASHPIRCLFIDEIDRCNEEAGREGDPAFLARARLTRYGERAKELLTGTPTIKNESAIEKEYLASSQGHWHVPCPHCGTMQELAWRDADGNHRLHWEGDPALEGSRFHAWYECVNGCVIEEHHKAKMLEGGRWVHTFPERRVKGYHLQALALPIGSLSWRGLVSEWIAANERARVGDVQQLKAFVNTRLAETWEDLGERIDRGQLEARGEDWGDLVPPGVRVMTAGADLQENRIEVEVVGWGFGLESWSLGYFVIHSDPLDQQTWRDLDTILLREWRCADGRILKASAACVDSGARTQAVYDYTFARRRWRCYAIKGVAGRRPIWDRKVRRGGKNKDKGIFFAVGVDTGKDALAAYLRVKLPGPGYCHFPARRAQEMPDYYAQLTAEHRIKVRDRKGHESWEWHLAVDGRRNEALDCRVYALAALHSLMVGGLRLDAPRATAAISSGELAGGSPAIHHTPSTTARPDAPPEVAMPPKPATPAQPGAPKPERPLLPRDPFWLERHPHLRRGPRRDPFPGRPPRW